MIFGRESNAIVVMLTVGYLWLLAVFFGLGWHRKRISAVNLFPFPVLTAWLAKDCAQRERLVAAAAITAGLAVSLVLIYFLLDRRWRKVSSQEPHRR
jgi:hypothetical protein